MGTIAESYSCQKKNLLLRDATADDVAAIQRLYRTVYRGTYPLDYANDPSELTYEIQTKERYLWIAAEDLGDNRVVGAILFRVDSNNRLGKAAGEVISPDCRGAGLGTRLLEVGIEHLTRRCDLVDAIYATTRTVSEGPSRMVAQVGFEKMGIFPNAVQAETLEHLTLDVYLTDAAMSARRKKPYLIQPFFELYEIARKTLGLERAYLVTERAPLQLNPKKIPLKLIDKAEEASGRFARYEKERRISNSFFPFHKPNWILETEDGGSEIFIWYGGRGKQASIVGYRTDRVNVHNLLDSVAYFLENHNAAYVELLVNAYDYTLQQEAFTARYIPACYFPSMRLNVDGLRDDFFVLSRTFRLLDFTGMVVTGDHYQYLQSYLRNYYELYIRPILGYDLERERNLSMDTDQLPLQ